MRLYNALVDWVAELVEALIHGASAGTARVAAASTRAAGTGVLLRLFPSDGKAGKLLTQPFALAFGAGGFLCAQHDGFKLMFALLAYVFKNWHIKTLG